MSKKKKKKKKLKLRNPYVAGMIEHCKGGPMKDKREKRQNGKNKQHEFLKELDDH